MYHISTIYHLEWEPEFFLLKIGGGTSEYADKFENIHQIFNASSVFDNDYDREIWNSKGSQLKKENTF